ncbi:hypothetical protein SalAn1F4_02490 [Streptococcus alactolyticus]|uniref:hypothetical protein n=1 Tax=Streptococcus alactolyticus TaxID=29389 RepID=UPI0021837CC9|nr:hypothetical protein [Streptococcus alactolyticus]GLB79316.1 hypothetical protein SalAn1F4_02490 [Streptococcus alactolyticus]
MKTKGHGTIKKSKAYGAIGTLLLSGVLVAAMGTTAVQADETVENSSATETLASTPQVATESTLPLPQIQKSVLGTQKLLKQKQTRRLFLTQQKAQLRLK